VPRVSNLAQVWQVEGMFGPREGRFQFVNLLRLKPFHSCARCFPALLLGGEFGCGSVSQFNPAAAVELVVDPRRLVKLGSEFRPAQTGFGGDSCERIRSWAGISGR
jgi:hypothetical protein